MLFARKTFVLAAAFAGLTAIASAEPAQPIVTIDSGKIAGSETDGMVSFLGIPFAAPPVGALRWKAPQPVKPWAGVRQATEFGPVCRQTSDWVKSPQSEDCLSLNVWAPVRKAARPYPVLVWIHGGGLVGGYGSEWGRDGGQSIVWKDVILVSLNYRLGVFGFFSHPELSAEAPDHASGNQGFRDQIAALQWIKRNIAVFGGDPNQVTIAGCSAGGTSVATLTISPLARNLFQRGISESGVIGPMPPQAVAEQQGVDLAKTLNAPHLADLRQISADELLKHDWQAMPHLDGVVLPENPRDSFAAGHQNKVPALVGWNADEGVDIAPAMFGTKDVTAANYQNLLQKAFGPQIPPFVLAQYPAKTDAEAKASLIRLTTDIIGLQHFGWAVMQQQTATQPVYLYHFVHSPAEPPKEYPCNYGCKAGHGAEIRFAYGLLWREPRDWNGDDLKLRDQMLGYWTNFAKSGDPNGEGLPPWAVFDGTPASVKRLGTEAEIKDRGNFPDFRPYLFLAQHE